MSLRAGSYLPEASDPEIGHVDIGGTHIAASVSTMVVFFKTKYPQTHIHRHTHTDTWGGWRTERKCNFLKPQRCKSSNPLLYEESCVCVCFFSCAVFFVHIGTFLK